MARTRKPINLTGNLPLDHAINKGIQEVIDQRGYDVTVGEALRMIPIQRFCNHVLFMGEFMQQTTMSIELLAEVMRDFAEDEE